MEKKKCLYCKTAFQGRVDKKYCSEQCRSNFNNLNRSDHERLIKSVNSVLRKNRSILKMLNPVGMSTVRKEYLDDKGFNFKYFTSLYTTKDGNAYHFCYDLGYMILDENKVRIVEYQKYMKQ